VHWAWETITRRGEARQMMWQAVLDRGEGKQAWMRQWFEATGVRWQVEWMRRGQLCCSRLNMLL